MVSSLLGIGRQLEYSLVSKHTTRYASAVYGYLMRHLKSSHVVGTVQLNCGTEEQHYVKIIHSFT